MTPLVALVLASIASVASAQSSSGSTDSSVAIPSAANTNASLVDRRVVHYKCDPPFSAVERWCYNSWGDGPYTCYRDKYGNSWSMFTAYRSGGTEGVHWKYTDDPNDSACLYVWLYYASDGQEFYASVKGRTTFERDTRRWCALPVYRSGGRKGYQWEDCKCYEV